MLQAEPDLYDCDTCAVRDAMEGLEPCNAEAWHFFQKVATRFAVDAGLIPELFRRFTADLKTEDFDDLNTRVNLIYDIVMPKPTTN